MSARSTSKKRPVTLAALAAVAVLALALAGCADDDAEQALAQVLSDPSRPLDELRDELQAVVDRWPESKAALRARRELESLDALRQSAARGLALKAWDAVREVAQAAEQYRRRHGRYPSEIDELLTKQLSKPVIDPWGEPVRYLRTGSGYKVLSYGSDSLPGGDGDGRDIVIDTGKLSR